MLYLLVLSDVTEIKKAIKYNQVFIRKGYHRKSSSKPSELGTEVAGLSKIKAKGKPPEILG